MSCLHKILILGGGVSATRFVESLMFNEKISLTIGRFSIKGKSKLLAKKYGIQCVSYNSILDFNDYDCIVLSVPYYAKLNILQSINHSNFIGALVIEKPYALTLDDYELYHKAINGRNMIVPLSRKFYRSNNYLDVIYDDAIKIVWPLYKLDNADVYLDLLPHCINWINMLIGDIEKLQVIRTSNRLIQYRQNDIEITIEFVDSNCCKKITVNKKEFPWIDIVATNNIIIDKIFTLKSFEQGEIYEYLHKDCIVIESILEYKKRGSE